MNAVWRVTFALVFLAAAVVVLFGGAVGGGDDWQVLDETGVFLQASDDDERPSTRSVFATYKDDQSARAETSGIAGVLANYQVAILTLLAFGSVWIAIWIMGRRPVVRGVERQHDES